MRAVASKDNKSAKVPSSRNGVTRKRHNTSINVDQPATFPVKSAGEYLEKLSSFNYSEKQYWYRGVSDSKYELLPSIFRHSNAKNQKALRRLELDLNDTFEMRSLPYAESRHWAKDVWELLFFMQHYRVPTRLLDWSGSPLVSLHFAVTGAKFDKDGNALNDAAVWILDPVDWNKASYSNTNFDGTILSAKDAWLNRYSPQTVYESPSNIPPACMRGVQNSPRIVAQQGYFTVFGPQAVSLEAIYSSLKQAQGGQFPAECLRKIVIPKESIKKIKSEIYSLGISESSIYPDLEGLATELKRTFGF